MRGGIAKYAIALIFMLVLVIALTNMTPDVAAIDWRQEFDIQEEALGTRGEIFEETVLLTRYSETDPADKIMLDTEDYFVSEISCDIAKDIYNDFTKYGVIRDELIASGGFIELGGVQCEYAVDLDDYICLVGKGAFRFNSDKELDLQARTDLANEENKCCPSSTNYCGCSYDSGGDYMEFKMDETCVNEILNNMKYELQGVPFCTEADADWLRLPERVKFGNNYCVKDSDNDGLTSVEGCDWNDDDACDTWFCAADGTLDPHQEDSIMDFWADDLSGEFIVDDSFLVEDEDRGYTSDRTKVLQQREYFYNVLWFNHNKTYAIMFTRIPTQQGRSFGTETEFADFLDDFFGLDVARKTTAGRYWVELATNYDGLLSLPEINIANIKSSLESSLDIYVDEVDCLDEESCINYDIALEIWGEHLRNSQTGEIIDLFDTYDETPLTLRKYYDDIVLPAGTYRVIIRNWYSGLFYTTATEECTKSCQLLDPYAWCQNVDIKAPGNKLFDVKGTYFNCPAGYSRGHSCCIFIPFNNQKIVKDTISRYVDKSIIIIPQP